MKAKNAASLCVLAGCAALIPAVGGADVPTQSSGSTMLHEVTAGTNRLSFSGGTTNLGFNVAYHYYLLPDYGLQVGLESDITYSGQNDIGNTTWNSLFGVRYNLFFLNPAMGQQFFVEFGLGPSYRHSSVGSATTSTTDFQIGLGVGKRFELARNFAWVPEVSVRKVFSDNWNLTIIPIALSFLFD